jgi:uncharacterized membrane protein
MPSRERPAITGRLTPPSISTTEEPPPRKRVAPGTAYSPRKMSSSEFNTAMVHFYRGEIQRANSWRNRLDTTTNWAVLTAGATLSFAFGNENAPHFVIIINSLIVAFFLFMEARRYRYYEIWASRVRVMETGYFAPMLSPDENPPDELWAEHMATDLITPHFTISEWEAVGRRLRRNYLWIFVLLASAWNLKVYLHPRPAESFSIFLDRATVGLVPGAVIFLAGILFNLTVITFALGTMRLRDATGEVLAEHDFSFHPLRRVSVWRRASSIRRRADKARQRVKKFETTDVPNRRLETTEAPNRPLVKSS